jgi:hypothetical protein
MASGRGRKPACSRRAPIPPETSNLSLSVSTTLGSILTERACTADYGDIGGVRRVNCRLAASALPPEETLRYRMRMNGLDETRVAVQYEFRF